MPALTPYRETPAPVRTMRDWKETNWGGELRVVGTVAERFQGKPMMTAPVLGIDKRPLRIVGQPDLLDDGMIVETLSGSRYLLRGRSRELR
jgi:hypothetical protein